MGVKLIILLALVVGALYCLHLLAQDYQGIRNPARFLFKRHLNSSNKMKPSVRWKKILTHDAISCARSLFCQLGSITGRNLTELESGLIYMISLEPAEMQEKSSYNAFLEAYTTGVDNRGSSRTCRKVYFLCPFNATNLLALVQHLIRNKLL